MRGGNSGFYRGLQAERMRVQGGTYVQTLTDRCQSGLVGRCFNRETGRLVHRNEKNEKRG